MSTVDLQRIECSNCGAGIDVSAAARGGRVACSSCGSILDRASLQKVGDVAAGNYDAVSNIAIGWTAHHAKTLWRVSGRVRYTYPGGYWDEWVMTANDGQVAYLEECEGEFRWFTAWTPRNAPTRQELETAQSYLQIDGMRWVIRERILATLAYFEGELPWRATTGQQVWSLDIKSPVEPGSIEWTRRELEFYKAKTRNEEQLRRMFQNHPFDRGDWPEDDDEDEYTEFSSHGQHDIQRVLKVAWPVLIFSFIILTVFLDECGGTMGGYGGHYSGSGWSGK